MKSKELDKSALVIRDLYSLNYGVSTWRFSLLFPMPMVAGTRGTLEAPFSKDSLEFASLL